MNRQWSGGTGLLVLALVGCDYFFDTTVPASDSTPPVAWAAVYHGGEHVDISSSNAGSPLSFAADPDEYYLLIGAGTDDGGTKKVTVSHNFSRTCVQGNLAQNSSGLGVPMIETQSGSVGATVSNGVWTGPTVRLRDYATCNAGWTLSQLTYSWHVTAEDFHGNTQTHGSANIHWVP
ncbi:hypothetical protein [Nannocystis pusilla]|uniref:hypothetical protein n=1 Tax=Nannocystis pusilla TaxID=889268 RepID=UPI003B7C33B5